MLEGEFDFVFMSLVALVSVPASCVELLVCGLGDEHAVADRWRELLDLVFEHLEREHLAS